MASRSVPHPSGGARPPRRPQPSAPRSLPRVPGGAVDAGVSHPRSPDRLAEHGFDARRPARQDRSAAPGRPRRACSWGRFPTAVATSGAAEAIASSAVSPNPSWVDGNDHHRRACRYSEARSGPPPVRRARAARAAATPRRRGDRPRGRWRPPAPGSGRLHRLVPSPRAACRGPCAGLASAGSQPRARTAPRDRAPRRCGRREASDAPRRPVPRRGAPRAPEPGPGRSASIASTRVVSLTAMIPAHPRMAGASSDPYSRRAAPDGPGVATARHISTSCIVTT